MTVDADQFSTEFIVRLIVTAILDLALLRATWLRWRAQRREETRQCASHARLLVSRDRLGRAGFKWVIVLCLHILIWARLWIDDLTQRASVGDQAITVIGLAVLGMLALDEFYANCLILAEARDELESQKETEPCL